MKQPRKRSGKGLTDSGCAVSCKARRRVDAPSVVRWWFGHSLPRATLWVGGRLQRTLASRVNRSGSLRGVAGKTCWVLGLASPSGANQFAFVLSGPSRPHRD